MRGGGGPFVEVKVEVFWETGPVVESTVTLDATALVAATVAGVAPPVAGAELTSTQGPETVPFTDFGAKSSADATPVADGAVL